ncbi:MAG TPA: FlgD immunoglobulin-like domain containing protein, partial [Candidatus Binatia bacterium]|nr:FlgD immunoglobulin-like domain containing protein [Candidatus Binatia bacterium]
IFDIRGGLVRTLVNDDLAKGAHVIVWDGHTATGQSVASGVYNYRLEALGKHLSRRLIVLK